jgi:hypothetical protein
MPALPIFSCLPAFLIQIFFCGLVNALAVSANPHGHSLDKGARASRPHLQSIPAGRMPALPFTKSSNYPTSPRGCLTP